MKQPAAGRVETQRLLMPLIRRLGAKQQIDNARIDEELHQSRFETKPLGHRFTGDDLGQVDGRRPNRKLVLAPGQSKPVTRA